MGFRTNLYKPETTNSFGCSSGAGLPVTFCTKSQKQQTKVTDPRMQSGRARYEKKSLLIWLPFRKNIKGINPATIPGARIKKRIDFKASMMLSVICPG